MGDKCSELKCLMWRPGLGGLSFLFDFVGTNHRGAAIERGCRIFWLGAIMIGLNKQVKIQKLE